MKYKVDKEAQKTAYLQIYSALKKDITDGVLPYGSKLPSKRLLAEEADISVITVEHAYRLLCDEGYAEAKERKGYFVIYQKSDFNSSADPISIAPVKLQNHHSVKNSFPFSTLCKTMRRVMLDYGERILIKSPNHGCFELRESISRYLARSCDITAHPEQIIIGSGSEYLYSLILLLLGKERTYALESPSYENIRKVYLSNGVTPEMLQLGHDGIKSDALKNSRATVLHITPFNSFPSGITASASKRYEYLRFARERNGFIIEDNYDSELTVSTKNEDTVFSLSDDENVIYLNTFSRTVAPSVRVGYAVLPQRLLESFGEKLGFYSCTVPVFEQYVLTEIINSGDFERHINRVRRKRRKST